MPWKNSWFQIACFVLLVSGALLIVDYAHKPSMPSEQQPPAKEQAPAWQAACPASEDPGPSTPANSKAVSAELAQGKAALDRNDYGQAMDWFQKAAAEGNADAENNIGALYRDGFGVQFDYTKAMCWFQRSAAQGNAEGERWVGVLYFLGHGVPQDYVQAIQWYEKAAAQGDATAEYNLGFSYENGLGVPKDETNSGAIAWYKKAAAQRDPISEEARQALARLQAGGTPR